MSAPRVRDVLAAGRAPNDWLRAGARAAERLGAVRRSSAWLRDVARAAPALCPAARWGDALGALTAGDAAAGARRRDASSAGVRRADGGMRATPRVDVREVPNVPGTVGSNHGGHGGHGGLRDGGPARAAVGRSLPTQLAGERLAALAAMGTTTRGGADRMGVPDGSRHTRAAALAGGPARAARARNADATAAVRAIEVPPSLGAVRRAHAPAAAPGDASGTASAASPPAPAMASRTASLLVPAIAPRAAAPVASATASSRAAWPAMPLGATAAQQAAIVADAARTRLDGATIAAALLDGWRRAAANENPARAGRPDAPSTATPPGSRAVRIDDVPRARAARGTARELAAARRAAARPDDARSVGSVRTPVATDDDARRTSTSPGHLPIASAAAQAPNDARPLLERRPWPYTAPVDVPTAAEPLASVSPNASVDAPELERRIARLLRDDARRHGIDV